MLRQMLASVFSGILLCGGLFADSGERRVSVFDNDGRALVNPMMGWVGMFYSSADSSRYGSADFSDTMDGFPGCGTVYMRVPWASLEPKEGQIDWSLIDTPAQRWISRGKKIALRFFTSSTGSLRYATPAWVQKAGAKMVPCKFWNFESMEPVFDDPVFLAKLENFLAAAGRRYNRNPNVAFIDIGTFGTWGEAHTLFSHKLPQEENERQARIHAELHLKYFPDMLLCISDDVIGPHTPGDDFPFLKELREKGITLRDDSILVNKNGWYHAELAQRYWPEMPVILEHEHQEEARSRGTWNNKMLLEAVEKYHASYLCINAWPDRMMEVCKDVIPRINRRLGYRILLHSVDYPAAVKPGEPFTVGIRLANAGVAPCYPGGFPAFTLKDRKGGIAAVLVDETFNLRNLPVGPPDKAPRQSHVSTLRINPVAPPLPGGAYRLYISMGDRTGSPQIAMPLEDEDGQRRYFVGEITVDDPLIGLYSGKANWIWNPVNPAETGATAFLTRTFRLDKVPETAYLDIVADDRGEVYVNGKSIATVSGWNRGRRLDLAGYLRPGVNLIAVAAKNGFSYSGILAELTIGAGEGGDAKTIVTDAEWHASADPSPEWESAPEVSAQWPNAKIIAPFGHGAWGKGVKLYR